MSASYPASIFSWTDRVDAVDDIMAADPNSLAAEIIAVQTDLVGASGLAGGLDHGEASFHAYLDKVLVPIGTIIWFYDFNAALSFDTDYWAYCDGSSKTVSGIGSQTLPDLSNRYLVGFGTEGGTDIDSASWATAAVGNASHQIDIAHTHSISFTSGAGSAHSHSIGISAYAPTGGGGPAIGSLGTNNESSHTHAVSGTSASSGSATQSIQPRSIRARALMRIA